MYVCCLYSLLELAFGVLPLLELRGSETVISGGRASARFVARKLGFLGQNELDEAKIDEILDGSQEFSAGKRQLQLHYTIELPLIDAVTLIVLF